MKELILNKVIEAKFKSAVVPDGTCPSFSNIYKTSLIELDNILDTDNIPSIERKSSASSSENNSIISKISTWLNIASSTVNSIIDEYEATSKAYEEICFRIFNESYRFRDAISNVINSSCIHILPHQFNQSDNSTCSKIGNYICLPFFIRNAEMYNSGIYARAYSNGEIVFSNLNRITSIPIQEQLSMKVSSPNKNVNLTISFSVDSDTYANMIYINMLNKVDDVTLNLIKSNEIIYTKQFTDSEILANFTTKEFDTISLSINYTNINTDKPYPIQIQAIEIFKKILFSKNGQFESNQIVSSSSSRMNSLWLEYNDTGDQDYVSTQKYVSVSSESDRLAFNKLEENPVDISVHKYRHSEMIDGINDNPIDYPQRQISNKSFYEVTIDQSNDDLWNIDFENALIFNGINSDYCETSGDEYFGQHFENWTKVGTFWRTMIYVTDEEAWVDIGSNTCKINGRENTGSFKLQKGISVIEVHEKDIDFKFGKEIIGDMSSESELKEDPLFPFNFAYMFSGLPQYDASGDIEPKIYRKFQVSGVSTIFLNEPFIPMSIEVNDSVNVEKYSMQLTTGVSIPGTFSIEPYSGKIKVYPLDEGSVEIQIRYRRASLFRRPLGVMFNRLLTFMPIKAIVSLDGMSEDNLNYKYAFDSDAFFTLDGDIDNRKLLLQNTSSDDTFDFNEIQHSQVIFNRTDESLYIVTKIEMETTDRYLTPTIKDIYLST